MWCFLHIFFCLSLKEIDIFLKIELLLYKSVILYKCYFVLEYLICLWIKWSFKFDFCYTIFRHVDVIVQQLSELSLPFDDPSKITEEDIDENRHGCHRALRYNPDATQTVTIGAGSKSNRKRRSSPRNFIFLYILFILYFLCFCNTQN